MGSDTSLRPKIALLVPGGIDVMNSGLQLGYLVLLISRLSERFDIVVYSLVRLSADTNPIYCGKAEVRFLGFQPGDAFLKKLFRLILTCLRDHKTERFDVVHGLWGTPCGLAAVLIGYLRNIPSVVSFLGGETARCSAISYGNMRSPLLRVITGWVAKKATVLIVLTRFQNEQLNREGILRTDIEIIPFGVDRQMFCRTHKKKDTGKIHFIYVGSLNRVKDPETMIQCFAALASAINCDLTIIGEDYLNGFIHQTIDKLDISSKVHYHRTVPYDQIPLFFRSADVLLLTSIHEAQGLVVAEAAASGVLICGSRVGLIHDFGNECSVSVEAGNPAALTSAILEILNDHNRLDMMREHAYEWSRIHDLEWTLERISALYLRSNNYSKD